MSLILCISLLTGASLGANAKSEDSSRPDGNWLEVKLLGTEGLVDNGMVNRNANGAVVHVTPKEGSKDTKSVSSSKNELAEYSALEFSLGKAKKADIEIVWPSGVKNRVYNVKRKRSVLLPEIPCSYDIKWNSFEDYRQCVESSVDQLKEQDIIGMRDKMRLYLGAKKAYLERWGGDEI